jgi:hypothetical protein
MMVRTANRLAAQVSEDSYHNYQSSGNLPLYPVLQRVGTSATDLPRYLLRPVSLAVPERPGRLQSI